MSIKNDDLDSALTLLKWVDETAPEDSEWIAKFRVLLVSSGLADLIDDTVYNRTPPRHVMERIADPSQVSTEEYERQMKAAGYKEGWINGMRVWTRFGKKPTEPISDIPPAEIDDDDFICDT